VPDLLRPAREERASGISARLAGGSLAAWRSKGGDGGGHADGAGTRRACRTCVAAGRGDGGEARLAAVRCGGGGGGRAQRERPLFQRPCGRVSSRRQPRPRTSRSAAARPVSSGPSGAVHAVSSASIRRSERAGDGVATAARRHGPGGTSSSTTTTSLHSNDLCRPGAWPRAPAGRRSAAPHAACGGRCANRPRRLPAPASALGAGACPRPALLHWLPPHRRAEKPRKRSQAVTPRGPRVAERARAAAGGAVGASAPQAASHCLGRSRGATITPLQTDAGIAGSGSQSARSMPAAALPRSMLTS
jgi:hypothetical protein